MSDKLSDVRCGYDRWATVYDHDANPLPALEEPIMRRAIGNVHGLNLLDLGCGTGRHSLWLAGRGAAVSAVDFSEGMLHAARRKPTAERVRWLCHDLHAPLPFGSGEFDLVVSSLVLEHLRELDSFFAQIARVLKPARRAVISAMHPAMFLRGSMARFTDPDTGELVQPGSIAHSISDFLMAAARAGLRLTHIEEVSPDAEFAARYPRAEKYIGWPMLVVMQLERE
ncbi:MAG TPA: class I SAM-dependent methyltransferase [Lacipirellulaceae bacterium]|nr:class I SAM-dependent methyltransferase [Lacipirellulaceae bacterium]